MQELTIQTDKYVKTSMYVHVSMVRETTKQHVSGVFNVNIIRKTS